MALSESAARELAVEHLLPALRDEKEQLDRIDRWWRWDHDRPHAPRQASREYAELMGRSYTPWLGLVVTSVAQALYVNGYRRSDATEDMSSWRFWQANRMDARQGAIYRAALAYGQSFAVALPGSVGDDPVPAIRGVSPRRMVASWDDPASDEWPEYALEASSGLDSAGDQVWKLKLYDPEYVHHIRVPVSAGSRPVYEGADEHGIGVTPVVRYANALDLEGRTPGEVEPYISIAGRINQTTFDRLVVQRFASWVVRTVSGMARPDDDDEARHLRMQLKVEDLLVAEDPDTKFGSLPATPLSPFIDAKDGDIRDLAAVTQTPPHHLLGQMANLSAEALAAAEASLNRKIIERKASFGESHESLLRLSARIVGDEEGWLDTSAQIHWRDMESRSLAQAADALGKLAQMLNVPYELLWEQIPGWSQTDVERARHLVEEEDGIQRLVEAMQTNAAAEEVPPSAPAEADG